MQATSWLRDIAPTPRSLFATERRREAERLQQNLPIAVVQRQRFESESDGTHR